MKLKKEYIRKLIKEIMDSENWMNDEHYNNSSDETNNFWNDIQLLINSMNWYEDHNMSIQQLQSTIEYAIHHMDIDIDVYDLPLLNGQQKRFLRRELIIYNDIDIDKDEIPIDSFDQFITFFSIIIEKYDKIFSRSWRNQL